MIHNSRLADLGNMTQPWNYCTYPEYDAQVLAFTKKNKKQMLDLLLALSYTMCAKRNWALSIDQALLCES